MNPYAEHFGTSEIDLRNVVFTMELLAFIPAELALRYQVLPVMYLPGFLRVAFADPSDPALLELLRDHLDCDMELVVADVIQMEEFVNRLYGSDQVN
jgi:hypothetical protein